MNDSKRVILANITWNPSKWRNNDYINRKAGHTFVRNMPGHESLNFDFNKSIDTPDDIFGYVQWHNRPKNLDNNAIMIFCSLDLEDKRKPKIVGIYGDVSVVEPIIKKHYPGFENDQLLANIKAKRKLSLLFPVLLDAKKYYNGKHLIPRAFAYKDIAFAEQIIMDEINVLKNEKGGILLDEISKLSDIYLFLTGNKIVSTYTQEDDEKEQAEVFEDSIKKSKEVLKNSIENAIAQDAEYETVNGKRYKRDNVIIGKIKAFRGGSCQICNTSILKKDGTPYTEAAHIIPKRDKGQETNDNILILCPNHHKEFDLGNTKIISHTSEAVSFEMNGIAYTIKLFLE